MSECDSCKHDYPEGLVLPCDLPDRTLQMCGVCALIQINYVHNSPKNMPFVGSQARKVFTETVRYRREHGIPIPDYINEMVK